MKDVNQSYIAFTLSTKNAFCEIQIYAYFCLAIFKCVNGNYDKFSGAKTNNNKRTRFTKYFNKIIEVRIVTTADLKV